MVGGWVVYAQAARSRPSLQDEHTDRVFVRVRADRALRRVENTGFRRRPGCMDSLPHNSSVRSRLRIWCVR
jgi:hypothetical protein